MKSLTKSQRKNRATISPISNFGWLQVFGSIFSVAGSYFTFEYEKGNLSTDSQAIDNDWSVIGYDMRSAMKSHTFQRQLTNKPT